MKLLVISLIRHPIRTVTSRKELRYLVAGGASAVIEYTSFLILLALCHLLFVSNSLSFLLGVVSGFTFHKTWSFRGEHQFKTRHQFIGYVSLAGINFIMINFILGFLVNGLHVHPAIAKFLSIAITVSWTFVLTNYVIFRHRNKELI